MPCRLWETHLRHLQPESKFNLESMKRVLSSTPQLNKNQSTKACRRIMSILTILDKFKDILLMLVLMVKKSWILRYTKILINWQENTSPWLVVKNSIPTYKRFSIKSTSLIKIINFKLWSLILTSMGQISQKLVGTDQFSLKGSYFSFSLLTTLSTT